MVAACATALRLSAPACPAAGAARGTIEPEVTIKDCSVKFARTERRGTMTYSVTCSL